MNAECEEGAMKPQKICSMIIRFVLLLLVLRLCLPDSDVHARTPLTHKAACAEVSLVEDLIASSLTGVVISIHSNNVRVYEKTLWSPKSDILKFHAAWKLMSEPTGERFALLDGKTAHLYSFKGYKHLGKKHVKGIGKVKLGKWRWLEGTDKVVFTGSKIVRKGWFGMEDKTVPAIICLDVVTGDLLIVPYGNAKRARSWAIDPRGKRIARGFEDGTVEIASASDGRPTASYNLGISEYGSLAFHPTKDILAVSRGDGRLLLFDLTGRKPLTMFKVGMGGNFLAFVKGGKKLLLGDSSQVRLFDLKGSRLETVTASSGHSYTYFHYAPGLSKVFASDYQSICELGFDTLAGPVTKVAWTPKQKRIINVNKLRKEKRIKEALALVDESMKEFPGSGNIRNLYAEIYLRDFKDPKRALQAALEQTRDLPEHPGGYYWAAQAYQVMGNHRRCGDVLTEYAEWHPVSPDVSIMEANCHYRAGQHDKALSALLRQRLQHPEQFEGWCLWLEGQIAKKRYLDQNRSVLIAQAGSPDARKQLVGILKCRILALPECVEMLNSAEKMGNGKLEKVIDSARAQLILETDFSQQRPRPKVSLDRQQAVPMAQALSEIWAILDNLPSKGTIPPIGGEYLTNEMMAMQKINPAFVKPLQIRINDKGQFAFSGGEWQTPDGKIDTSYQPGRHFLISYVQGGALHILSFNFEHTGGVFSFSEYRPSGRDLIVTSTNWTEYGGVYYRGTHATHYMQFKGN